MKTTIKLGLNRAFTVSPSPSGVLVEFRLAGVCVFSDVVSPDQAGALIFGIEQALEVGEVAKGLADREFWRPDADTPFPELGGVCCTGECNQGGACPERRSA